MSSTAEPAAAPAANAQPTTAALPPKPQPTAPTPSSSTTTTTNTSAAVSSTASPHTRLTIDKTALVCDKAILDGVITVAANTIIHPRARLIAAGPGSSISVGANSIIEDGAVITATADTHLTLGNWLLIEPLATVAASMGHANHVRACAVVTERARVGRGVEVGVRAVVDGVVEDGSVVASDGSQRRAVDGGWTVREREKRVMETIQLQLMASRDLIIKNHKLIR